LAFGEMRVGEIRGGNKNPDAIQNIRDDPNIVCTYE
jgi:hypothetical protein